MDALGPYAPALRAYLDRTRGAFAGAQSPAAAADVIVGALTEDAPAFRVQTSEQARGFVGVKLADVDGSAIQSLVGGWISAD